MKLTRLPLCLVVSLSVVILATSSYSQTLSLSPTAVSDITHSYNEFFGDAEDQNTFTFGTPLVQLADYNKIEVTVSAPEGMMWHVAYNPEWNYELIFRLSYFWSFSAPYASIISSSWDFDLVEGDPVSLGSLNAESSIIPNSGDRFWMYMKREILGEIAFTGFTATLEFNNSGMAHAALSNFTQSSLELFYISKDFSVLPDPGAQLSLLIVPEPSSVALGILGGSALLFGTMRRRKP